MITNPQIGMTVKCKGWYAEYCCVLTKVGIIVELGGGYGTVVSFGGQRYAFPPEELDLVLPSPEEQDLKNRAIHADKYL